ncbi:MAG: GTPase obg [candidate division WS6 bacterium GW2011_GWE1_34_7]|uniref:GTPase obg n=1 Tax=candidate division WS6 bacterium GW2011_GWE1_34_7 TaxID=1619093 RepID=A0A0G0BR87_9BACT|nr:MAG: GTPase obg [candidate division WS6 bacterium GW2011_GWE1_34_7]
MIDTIQIQLESGKGGDGIIAFDNIRKADGGSGGKGGDVYLVGDRSVFDFTKISQTKVFKAENGSIGEKNKRTGKNGKDIEIHIPLVTKIFNEDGTEFLTITKHDFRIKILDGGIGGLGNFSLRGEGWDGKLSRTKGEESQKKILRLELNLKADVIFLGYPNVGKSSIVNALSNAKYRVAPYEFTTLQPQLAVMDNYVLMDLPGLIEGTYKGKGLGTKFLKHTKYSKLVVHCISLENEDVKKAYKSMRDEFKNISEFLYSLPELILFTKGDIYSTEQLEEVQSSLKKDFKDFKVISVYKQEDMKELKELLKERLSSVSDAII